jgi:hypothetical protein
MAFRHVTMLSAALAAALALSSTAQACTLSAWTVNGSISGVPVAGGPGEAAPNNTIRRYSGLCGMRADNAGDYVQNNDPANDTIFRARFYVLTSLTSGSAVVYQAGNSTNQNEIEVSVNRGSHQIEVRHRGGSPIAFPINTAQRWYSVELAMNATGSATTGDDPIPANTLIARVGGGGSDTVAQNTTSVTSGAAIDFARLGKVSGAGAGSITVEEYESTRSAGTAIGRLCRGDANGNGVINNGDRVVLTNELLEVSLATGVPDCTEDGVINPGDRVCITNLILADAVCP